jgi:5-methylcytosine-specific restriction enzyme A
MSGPRGQHRAPWNQWYNREVWRRRSRRQRWEQPLCAMCLALGRLTPATVADHIEPHRGDWNSFLTAPLQSLCFDCHNSKKKSDEERGYSRELGPDGWPIDPNHPANVPHQWRTKRAARAAHKRKSHGGTIRPATPASTATSAQTSPD